MGRIRQDFGKDVNDVVFPGDKDKIYYLGLNLFPQSRHLHGEMTITSGDHVVSHRSFLIHLFSVQETFCMCVFQCSFISLSCPDDDDKEELLTLKLAISISPQNIMNRKVAMELTSVLNFSK